jgi:tetratricopeptide (TPR) repeat protein
MKGIVGLCILVGLTGLGSPTVAQNADAQFKFAEQLYQEGDAAFALLEYKRFIFLFPNDARVPQARLNTAEIYLTSFRSLDQGKQALAEVTRLHPGTPEAKQADELLKFILVNSDFDGEPLLGFLDAQRLKRTKRFAAAVAGYSQVATKYSQARLAPVALVEAGRLQLAELNQPDQALATFQRVTKDYGTSAAATTALFLTAQATEKLKGPSAEAIQAYEAVLAVNPPSPYRAQAQEALDRIRAAQNLPKRQFDKQLARPFKLIKKDYDQDTSLVVIEVALGLSEPELKATLEEALFQDVADRRSDKHSILVTAFYTFPITEAGSVRWTPGSAPVFNIVQRKKEDVIKDVLIDIFRKR